MESLQVHVYYLLRNALIEDIAIFFQDVLRLAKEVPGVRKLMKVPLKDFGHVDHLYATHSYELEYKDIIDIMLGRNI